MKNKNIRHFYFGVSLIIIFFLIIVDFISDELGSQFLHFFGFCFLIVWLIFGGLICIFVDCFLSERNKNKNEGKNE